LKITKLSTRRPVTQQMESSSNYLTYTTFIKVNISVLVRHRNIG